MERILLSGAQDEEEKKEVLKNIYNTYFLREVWDILGLIDDYKLEKLIRSLAFGTSILNFKKTHPEIEVVFACLKSRGERNSKTGAKAYPAYVI